MATIMEILAKPLEERKQAYDVSGKIDEVTIDGQKFSGYKAFSFLWEKSYHKEPTRSSDGVIGNLNDYTSFVTPHLKIDFSVMSIDDYRRIMQLLYSKNEFVVTCYDVVNNRMTTNKMYFSTEEMPKLILLNRALNGESWIEFLGIDGYTVEMVGTNADLDNLSVTYLNINPTTGTFQETITKDYYAGQEIIIGDGVDFKETEYTKDGKYYSFSGLWYEYKLDQNGYWQKSETPYRDNTALSLERNITLGIDFKSSSTQPSYTVSLNYGLGEEKTDIYGSPILSISMKNGDIFDLTKYTTQYPEVDFLGNKYNPYMLKGWYYTPVIADGSTSLNGTRFDKSHNVSIYQVYEPNEYTLRISVESGEEFEPITAKYGTSVVLPIPKKDGYNFAGWYFDFFTFKDRFDGKIPPTHTVIYAKWETNND